MAIEIACTGFIQNSFMQRLIIKNFGPIKDLDMEVKDFMLFIGPQASGKSTIAKAVYFFKSLKEDVLRYLLDSIELGELEIGENSHPIMKVILSKFYEYWDVDRQQSKQELEYHYSDSIKIFITNSPTGKSFKFSETLNEWLYKLTNKVLTYLKEEKERKKLTETKAVKMAFESRKKILSNEIIEKVNQLFNDKNEILFIPASRSILTSLSTKIGAVNWENLDYLMKEFVNEINSSKTSFSKSLQELAEEKQYLTTKAYDKQTISLAQKKIRSILHGNYAYNGGREYLNIENNEYVRLHDSSSGQQESLWILLLIYLKILYNKNIFLVIEEPEAHLFPEAQKHIMELVALLFNTTDSQVMITTHSPYILSSLNNLLYAGKLGKTKNGKVNALIDSKLWIDIDRTDAMYVHRPGTPPESIMDREQAMIKVERLDEISEVINAEFDKLMDIEFE